MKPNTLNSFEDYLRSQGLRLTGQRRQIAHVFFKHRGHISSEELYRRVQKTLPEIGFTTVYRTLKLLTDAGLAVSKNFQTGFARFESALSGEHHDHLVCTQCGEIIEFVNDRIEALQDAVAKKHGFTVTDHSLDIYGICRACKTDT